MENLLSYDDIIHNTLEICNFNNKGLALYIQYNERQIFLPVAIFSECRNSV